MMKLKNMNNSRGSERGKSVVDDAEFAIMNNNDCVLISATRKK